MRGRVVWKDRTFRLNSAFSRPDIVRLLISGVDFEG